MAPNSYKNNGNTANSGATFEAHNRHVNNQAVPGTATRNIAILEIPTINGTIFEVHNSLDYPEYDERIRSLMLDLANVMFPSDSFSTPKYTLAQLSRTILAWPDGSKFHGIPKVELVAIIDTLQTIQIGLERNLRNNIAFHKAVYSLHQELRLSPNLICNILGYFQINMTIHQILNSSDKIMRMGIMPAWICRAESTTKQTRRNNGRK